jgi:hypothetical protein
LKAGVVIVNAWVLSLIICGASPSPAGDYCQVVALRSGVTREACRAELEKWRGHASKPRLECTEDPSVVKFLAEQEDEVSGR